MLQDETLLYNGVIVQHSYQNRYFIIDILYCIPDKYCLLQMQLLLKN